MNNFIIRYDEVVESNRKSIGEKAANLALINKFPSMSVPMGFIIPAEVFLLCLQENGMLNEIERFAEGMSFDQIHLLQKKIQAMSIPETIKNSILNECSIFRGKTVAVRSSFSFEDTNNRTFAGMFASTTDVHLDESLFEAVKKTWASAFTPILDNKLFTKYGIGVIIQEYIRPHLSGVAFSSHFTNKDEIVIVYNDGPLEGLTSGTETGTEILFHKDNLTATDDQQYQVVKAVLELEQYFGYAVDVEWAISSDFRLFILQCREVNHQRSLSNEEFKIIDVDSLVELQGFELGDCKELHKKWYVKKHWVRMAALEVGIPVSKARYIRYSPLELTDKDVELISQHFQTKWVEIYQEKRRFKVRRSQIGSYLRDVGFNESRFITIRIEEVIPTYESGIATIEPKSDLCYIEIVPGGINGVRDGQTNPSKIYIQSQGPIKLEMIEHTSMIAFDDEKGQWYLQFLDTPIKLDVTANKLKQIHHLSRAMFEKFGEARVEWIYNGKEVYCFDLSIETVTFSLKNDIKSMSPGSVSAPIWKFNNISDLDNIGEDHVSVWRSDFFYNAQESINLNKILKNYSLNTPPILVCEYPNTKLALLSKHVAGFIFEKGSLLCHLAIILREEGVPAVIVPNALSELENGKLYSIG